MYAYICVLSTFLYCVSMCFRAGRPGGEQRAGHSVQGGRAACMYGGEGHVERVAHLRGDRAGRGSSERWSPQVRVGERLHVCM